MDRRRQLGWRSINLFIDLFTFSEITIYCLKSGRVRSAKHSTDPVFGNVTRAGLSDWRFSFLLLGSTGLGRSWARAGITGHLYGEPGTGWIVFIYHACTAVSSVLGPMTVCILARPLYKICYYVVISLLLIAQMKAISRADTVSLIPFAVEYGETSLRARYYIDRFDTDSFLCLQHPGCCLRYIF